MFLAWLRRGRLKKKPHSQGISLSLSMPEREERVKMEHERCNLLRYLGKNTAYISSACNLTPHSADWGRNSHIAYASCNGVAINYAKKYPSSGSVVAIIHTNKDRVNAVQWLKTSDGSMESETVSSSTDGKIVVWHSAINKLTTLEGHTKTVTILDSLYLTLSPTIFRVTSDPALIVSASADSTVKIWRRIGLSGQFFCIQTLSFGSGLCLSLRLCPLPGTQSVLLACAMDDARIYLFVENLDTLITEGRVDETAESHFVKVDVLIGHEDWVRAMDFCVDDSGDILLASGSQDTTIRLWRISRCSLSHVRKRFGELGPLDEIQAEERIIKVADTDGAKHFFTVTIESVLSGHDGWIYGIHWQPAVFEGNLKVHQPMRLLSCSMDKTMIIWAPDAESEVWLDSVRVGEVGGNTLGFYGCKFAPDGLSIMGHGFQGAMHVWNYSQSSESWQPGVTCGGHFREVVDVQWEPKGQFLISLSEDQTTRLHAPWVQDDPIKVASWHEIARPQVHGYDMSCLAILSRYRFVSGAEEKVIRAFEAPRDFINNLGRISRVTDRDGPVLAAPLGASVPSLGLSNKAVYEDKKEVMAEGRHVKNEYPEAYFVPTTMLQPPTEENLIQNTLWPEIRKLYGHGYELFSLAATHDGRTLASACKASTAEHAAVILWDTATWKELQKLPGHQLTVTQMSFSPDDNSLVSVSRDRTWCLYERNFDDLYYLVARTDKKTGIHARIIWCCAWSHDSRYFATGSREGKFVVWGRNPAGRADTPLGEYHAVASYVPSGGVSVTALAFAPDTLAQDIYLLAVGVETGNILLGNFNPNEPNSFLLSMTMSLDVGHHLAVKRLAFRPVFGVAGSKEAKVDAGVLQLASCGSDHAVKVFNINLKQKKKYQSIPSS